MDIFYYTITPFIVLGFIKADKKLLISFFIILFLLLAIVLITYYRRGDDFNYFLNRISLQGQMIYALDALAIRDLDFNFMTFLNSFLGVSSNLGNTGMYHLMYQIAPAATVDVLVEYKQTFTAPFPSNFTYFFTKYFAPIAIFIYSIPVAFSIFLFYKAIYTKSLLNIFCAATLFHYLSIATLMGKTERLIHPITISTFLFMIILLVLGRECHHSESNSTPKLTT